MFNRDALNNEWLEASKAYKKYVECRDIYDNGSEIDECNHKMARRNKDGSRDKRSPCRGCWDDMYRAQDLANELYLEWTPVWEFLGRIGMSVK